jgi:hypothetical protein
LNSLTTLLRAELHTLGRSLQEPALWLLLAAMLLLAALAYRAPFAATIDIGGSPPVASNCIADDVFDRPYIDGFNLPDSEYDVPRARCQEATVAYRWAFANAGVTLPGVGRAPLRADLSIVALPPAAAPITSTWSLGETPLLTLPLDRPRATYHLLLPRSPSADLELRFQSSAIQPPGDPREIAFAADALSVGSLGPAQPDWRQLGLLAAIAALGYGLLRRWSLPMRWAALILAIVVLLLAALLLWQRLGLTLATARIAALLLAGYALTIVLEPLARSLARLLDFAPSAVELRSVGALIVLAWLIRALGLLHPQTYSSDIGLNVNNLLQLTRGDVIFTENLPGEAGGGPAPYPPGQYIALLPFQLFTDETNLLLTVGNALADSAAILWLWLILRSFGQPPPAAGFAAALYLFAAPLLTSLSVGEMANIWGQSLVLPWAMVLLLWRRKRVPDLLLGATTGIVLLGHFGVLLSLLSLGAALLLVWLFEREARVWRLIGIGGAALLLVALLYYTAPPLLSALLDRPAAPPTTSTAAQRIWREAAELLLLSGVIGPLLAMLGLAGLVLAWRRCRELGSLLLAWWLSVLLSWATLLISQQALRWESFIFPALALGGGIALADLWSRSQLLRLTAVLLTAALLLSGGLWWIDRLISYR